MVRERTLSTEGYFTQPFAFICIAWSGLVQSVTRLHCVIDFSRQVGYARSAFERCSSFIVLVPPYFLAAPTSSGSDSAPWLTHRATQGPQNSPNVLISVHFVGLTVATNWNFYRPVALTVAIFIIGLMLALISLRRASKQ